MKKNEIKWNGILFPFFYAWTAYIAELLVAMNFQQIDVSE